MKVFSEITRKNILTFLIGPLFLVPATILGVIALALVNGQSDEIGSTFGIALMIAIYGLIVFAYPLTLIFGLPSIYLLERYNKLYLHLLVLLSFVGAAVPAYFTNLSIMSWLMFCYCSASVSIGCWYVYKKL